MRFTPFEGSHFPAEVFNSVGHLLQLLAHSLEVTTGRMRRPVCLGRLCGLLVVLQLSTQLMGQFFQTLGGFFQASFT